MKPQMPAGTAPALSPAVLAEVRAADLETNAVNGPAVPEGALAAPPAPPSQAAELAGLLLVAGQALAIAFPSVRPVYTETRCKQVADAVAPALERFGIVIPLGSAGVLLPAAAAVFVLAWETRVAIVADLELEKRRAVAAERAARTRSIETAPTPAEPANAQTNRAEHAPPAAPLDESAVLRPVALA